MGALVGHSASLAKPSIADSARARYLEWKHPDDFPAISGGEGQFNSAKYLAEKDRMTHDNPHSIRSAAEPIATDPSATVINQYARNLYGTHNDVLNRINDLLKQAPSPERDAALAQYRQMRFRTASLLDELDPPEFSPANERGTPRDRFRLLAENDSTAGNIINSLPMDEASRLNRAREMGFDTDNVAYRGLSRPYDDAEASKLYYQMFTSSPAEAAEYAMGNPLAKPNVVPTYLRKGRNLEVDASNQNFNAVPTNALPDDIRAKLRGDVARTDEIAHAARGLGYDSVTIKNVIDNATNEVIQAPKENPALKAKRAAEMDAILAELGDLGDLPPAPAAVSRGYEGVAPHERGPVTVNAVFDPKNIRSKYAAFNPLDSDKAGLLLSKSDNPTGTAINALAESRKGVDAAGPRDTLNKGLTPSEHGSSAAAARNTAGWIDLYHGTGKDFDSFRTDRPAFLSDKKEIAQIYADAPSRGGNPQIKQFRAPMKNPLDVTEGDGGKGWATVVLEKFGKEPGGPKGRHQRAIDAAREAGHDMVRISDHLDLGGPQIQYVPTDASALKSAGPRDTAAAAALPERAFRDSSTRQQAKAPGAEPSTSSSLNSAEAQLPERAFGKKHPSMTQDSKAFDWSNPGGPDATGAHARTKKIGDTTVMYGVGKDGTAELISVRTPQTKRGKGSARDALVKFLEEADAMGLEVKLQSSPLDKRTHGGRLQAFYESLGFKPTGRTINPVGDPEMIRAAKRDNLPERAFKD
jgi:hypothetical protein